MFPSNPLPCKEVMAIARSIASWTWKRFTAEDFSEIQRGRKAKWTAKYSQKHIGLDLLKNGFTTTRISEELGIPLRTVQRWSKEQKEAELLQLLEKR